MLRSFSLEFVLAEIEFSFVRSSGPGGQNVNKVNSKAELRWCVVRSQALPPPVLARFCEKYAGRITSNGEIIITSDQFRDQARNKADCVEKLSQLIRAVLHPPKKRLKTKPTRSSREKRHTSKRKQGEIKKARARPSRDD